MPKTNIVLGEVPQSGKPDFSGLPHESLREAIARGVKIECLPSNCREDYPCRKVQIDFKQWHKSHLTTWEG